ISSCHLCQQRAEFCGQFLEMLALLGRTQMLTNSQRAPVLKRFALSFFQGGNFEAEWPAFFVLPASKQEGWIELNPLEHTAAPLRKTHLIGSWRERQADRCPDSLVDGLGTEGARVSFDSDRRAESRALCICLLPATILGQ